MIASYADADPINWDGNLDGWDREGDERWEARQDWQAEYRELRQRAENGDDVTDDLRDLEASYP